MKPFTASGKFNWLRCKICWQIVLSLCITIFLAELIFLYPMFMHFRQQQLQNLQFTQLENAKIFLNLKKTQPMSPTVASEVLKSLNFDSFVIHDQKGHLKYAYGNADTLTPMTIRTLIPIGYHLFQNPFGEVYALWGSDELNSAYEITAKLNESQYRYSLRNFLRLYWDEALLILLCTVFLSYIVSYFWLIRPTKKIHNFLQNNEFKQIEPGKDLDIFFDNELGYIFKQTHLILFKFSMINEKLKQKSEDFRQLNLHLEEKVAQRTQALKNANLALKNMALLPEENINPVFRVDLEGHFLYTNRACIHLLKHWHCQDSGELPDKLKLILPAVYQNAKSQQMEISTGNKTYLLEFIPIAEEKYINGYGMDITAKKQAEKEKAFLQNYNPVTRLYNKNIFKLLLEEKVKTTKKEFFYLLFIQINDLISINQNLGHSAGDLFLRESAKVIGQFESEHHIIGHFSQNIFVLAVFTDALSEAVNYFADKIIHAFQQPLNIYEHSLRTSINIGIARYPQDSETLTELFKYADMALLKAVSKGVNQYSYFERQLNKEVTDRHKLYQALHDAVQSKQLDLFYQPQLNLISNQIIGAEALIRWHHPTYGLLNPKDFIAILEKSSLIFDITEWLFESAILLYLEIKKQFNINVKIAVNLTAEQLHQKNLFSIIESLMKTYGVSGQSIEIEITERTSLIDPESTVSILKKLQALGITIALDDFGTEYSSLSYLQTLPINKVKIDKAFLDSVLKNQEQFKIIKAIIQMAKTLNLSTLAEGIETLEQQNLLKSLGCDAIQGYLISKPLMSKEFIQLIQNQN